MTDIFENLNGLELVSGRLVTLFLTLSEAEEAVKRFPAGTHVKVTNDPNPDLNGEYTWDGIKLLKTTNNLLEKAKEQSEEITKNAIESNVTASNILEIIEGQITASALDRRLEQRIDKIPAISNQIEEMKTEVSQIEYELGTKLNSVNYDIGLINKYVGDLNLIIEGDFTEIKEQIKQIQDQVTADFEELQKVIDEKFVEVDNVRADLNKEIQDRITAIKNETDTRVAEVKLLKDGLTQEILDRKDGDKALLENIENYKVSNETSMANIREQVTVAIDTANASAVKVDALDVRVTSAENNSTTALENSASAVSKVTALANDVSSVSQKVDSLETQVIKAVDDSGKALTNSATAISQAQTAVDLSNATASQVTVVEAKLNEKSTTYLTDVEPTASTNPNITKGDIWINPSKNNEQKRWNGTAWVDVSDVRIGDSATAISKLTTTVTEQGDIIQATANKVDNLETSLEGKADASALQQLTTTVTDQGGKIQTNSESITALGSKVDGKADASALSDLTTVVTQQGNDIVSQGQAITAVENKLDGKADSSAVSELKSTVTQQGKDITAQGQAITGLKQEVDGKASSQAVNELKSTVTQQGNDIATQGQSISSLQNSLAGKADASALNALTTTVTQQGDTITSHGQSITSLQNSLDGKASITALDTLSTKVTEHDGKIDSQGVAITGLQNQIKDKADASALTELKTTVTQQGNDITAQGLKIDKVDAKIDAIDVGGENLLVNSSLDTNMNGWSMNNVASYVVVNEAGLPSGKSSFLRITHNSYGSGWYQGVPSVRKGEEVIYSIWARGKTGTEKLLMLLEGHVTNKEVTLTTEWKRYSFKSKTRTDGVNVSVYFGNGGVSDVSSIQYERGNVLTDWNLNPKDTASSSALSALDAKVTKQGQDIVATNSAVTALDAKVNNKADASALNSLSTTVSQQGDKITSQGQSITALNNQIKDKADSSALNELKSTVTQQGDKITSQGENITAIDTKVKNLSVGAENLIEGSDFSNNGNKDGFFNGGNAIVQTYKSTGGVGYIDMFGAKTNKALYGKEYILSFWAKAEEEGSELRNHLYNPSKVTNVENSQGYKGNNPDGLSIFKLTTGWVKYWTKWTMGKTETTQNVLIRIPEPPAGKTVKIWLATPKFEEGNIPTDWGIANSEVASATAVSSLKATVEQNGKDITALGQSVVRLDGRIDGKAETSALNTLNTKVIEQGNTLSAQSNRIDALNTKVDGKADASVLTKYYTNVETDDKVTTTVANSISTYDANLVVGTRNFARNTSGTRQGFGWVFVEPLTEVLIGQVTISYDLENVDGTTTGSGVGFRDNTGKYLYVWYPDSTTGRKTVTVDVNSTGYQNFGIYLNSVCKISNIKIEKGRKRTDWSPAPEDAIAGIQANANAVESVRNEVTNIGGAVTTLSQKTTTLETRMNNTPSGGGNLLINPDFALKNLDYWGVGSHIESPNTGVLVGGDLPDYQINAGLSKTAKIHVSGNQSGTQGYCELYQGVAVEAGKSYQISAYTGAHRCNVILFAYFYDKNGNYISNSSTDTAVNRQEAVAGRDLVNWKRLVQNVVAPPNAVKLQLTLRKQSGDDAYMFVTRAQIVQTDGVSQGAVGWVDASTASIAKVEQQMESINGIKAQWTIKTDVNGYVAGAGLMNDGNTSEFIIRADRFAIANPTGTGKKYGFVYQASDKWLPNGTYIPAGLYIDNLILGDIDARKINADSISAISANLGRFESNVAGKGKTVISGTEYQVFDANGVERIFLGVR